MGEAKKKREKFRKDMTKIVGQWTFPASEWEAETIAEISSLEVIMVQRAMDKELEWGGLRARECHGNALFMAENDPSHQIKHILGWWPQEGNFILHSVIQLGEKLLCVTPSPFNIDNPFPFIPDPKILIREEDGCLACYRDGQRLGPGLRSDPERTIRVALEALEILKNNNNPYDVLKLGW